MHPSDAQLLFLDADRCYQGGDVYSARQKLEALLQAAPDHADGHNYLGWLLTGCFDRAFLDEAVEHLREALRIDPRHRLAPHNLADAYFSRGDIAEAQSWYLHSIEISSGEAPLSNYGLALCAEVAGDLRRALTLTRRAARSDPQSFRKHVVEQSALRLQALMRRQGRYFFADRDEELLELLFDPTDPDLAGDEDARATDDELITRVRGELARSRGLIVSAPPSFAGSALHQLDAIEGCLDGGRLLPALSGKEFILGQLAARELDGASASGAELASSLSELSSAWDHLRVRWYASGR